MIAGLSGTLLSHEALERMAREPRGLLALQGRFRHWHARVRAQCGPTSGARMVFDRIAAPLFGQLGYRVIPLAGGTETIRAALQARGTALAGLIVTGWGRDASTAWREAVQQGIGLDARWCFCVSGPVVRIVDSRRTYSRRFIEFALEPTLEDEKAFRVFWSLVRADAALAADPEGSTLNRAIALSEEHRTQVRGALQQGVQDGLVHLLNAFAASTRRRGTALRLAPSRAFDEALIVIYRVLFLLFAEARGLVPRWHPIYRDGYTIEALRDSVELLPRPRGLWDTLQAIARLAHEGCAVGALRVPPFNGRLFSPDQSPLADTLALDDGAVRQAVLALTTRQGRTGRVRVAYGDLGVEQLGGVYERLLALEPATVKPGARQSLVRSETRKATGSFYTPRSLTEFVVRRTLAPLVRDASPERILALRVLDPAMGSGAFLVAVCRYLASAYEAALVREGGFAAGDITEEERVEFRRAIAQRCLFGVDVNPMAVQLGRLSIWLATLSADRPLTFLDHRLRVGNSLVGATLEDLLRQPPACGRAARPADLPLFDGTETAGPLGSAVAIRSGIAHQPDDSLAHVRAKELALASLADTASALTRWKAVADLWCAGWFRPAASRRQAAAAFGALMDGLLGRRSSLPPAAAAPLLEEARQIAGRDCFFHWTLEYPEVFYDAEGQMLESAGFDAILGNPPWEMLRGDRGPSDTRDARRRQAAQLTAFARTSGVYRFQGTGHANLYQLFVDRAAALLRSGGRLGMILPAGFALDRGSAPLRRALFDRTEIDGLISIENREGIFPIHRGLKFLIVSATKGGRTTSLTCRFGVRSAETLDELPDDGEDRTAVVLSRGLIERVSGPSLAVPELRTVKDVAIVSDLAFRFPALGDESGWGVRFGRELNATDDRGHFVETRAAKGRALPVVEGKHVTPFVVDLDSSTLRLPASTAGRLLKGPETFGRARLAYRDVASAGNRLSLIAAIVPAGAVTTHTLFCLKDALDEESQHYLCGLFNSFVANYLIRPRIATHVGADVIGHLPAPRLPRTDHGFRQLARFAALLAADPSNAVIAATQQAAAARVYGVSRAQFAHILETFPLVELEARRAAMRAFCDIVS